MGRTGNFSHAQWPGFFKAKRHTHIGHNLAIACVRLVKATGTSALFGQRKRHAEMTAMTAFSRPFTEFTNMAEILGLGLSHYPPLSTPDAMMSGILRTTLKDPGIPDSAKDPANWPEVMRTEWAND